MWQQPKDLSPRLPEHGFEHPLLERYFESQKPDLARLPRELREVVSCIHSCLFETGLTVKIVRDRCRIRDNNISSRFRRALGQGMKSYIDRHRMAAAESLLCGSDLAIFDVAMAVGYSHVETFYQVFHRHYACTPGRYRHKVQRSSSATDG
ncbi:MAG: helix-turn-helix transcriptional regulator [Acidobacteriota bacterium]